jgi:hypothetical protein
MELSDFQKLEVLLNLPWYVYFIGIFALAIIFSRKKQWEYEAKLFAPDSDEIMGEIEFEKFEKKPPSAELQGQFLRELYDKEIEVILDGLVIQRIKMGLTGTHYEILFPVHLDQAEQTDKNKPHYRPKHARRFNSVTLLFATDFAVSNKQAVEIRVDKEIIAHGIIMRD